MEVLQESCRPGREGGPSDLKRYREACAQRGGWWVKHRRIIFELDRPPRLTTLRMLREISWIVGRPSWPGGARPAGSRLPQGRSVVETMASIKVACSRTNVGRRCIPSL